MLNKYRTNRPINLIPSCGFRVKFFDIPANTKINFMNVNKIRLSQLVKSVDIANLNISFDDMMIGGMIKLPIVQNVNVEDLNISFFADSEKVVYSMYYQWIKLMFNNDGSKNPYGMWTKDITVYLYSDFDITNNDTPILVLKYKGCYPSNMEKFTFDYSKNDYVETISINFKVSGGVEIEGFNEEIGNAQIQAAKLLEESQRLTEANGRQSAESQTGYLNPDRAGTSTNWVGQSQGAEIKPDIEATQPTLFKLTPPELDREFP